MQRCRVLLISWDRFSQTNSFHQLSVSRHSYSKPVSFFFFSFLIFSSKKWRKWTWRPRQSAWTCGWDHRTCRPTCSSMRCASPDHSSMITIQNHRLPRPPALTQPTSLGHSRRSLMTRTARPGTVWWVRALGLLWLTLPPGFFTSPLTPSLFFSSKRRFSWSRNLEYDQSSSTWFWQMIKADDSMSYMFFFFLVWKRKICSTFLNMYTCKFFSRKYQICMLNIIKCAKTLFI